MVVPRFLCVCKWPIDIWGHSSTVLYTNYYYGAPCAYVFIETNFLRFRGLTERQRLKTTFRLQREVECGVGGGGWRKKMQLPRTVSRCRRRRRHSLQLDGDCWIAHCDRLRVFQKCVQLKKISFWMERNLCCVYIKKKRHWIGIPPLYAPRTESDSFSKIIT